MDLIGKLIVFPKPPSRTYWPISGGERREDKKEGMGGKERLGAGEEREGELAPKEWAGSTHMKCGCVQGIVGWLRDCIPTTYSVGNTLNAVQPPSRCGTGVIGIVVLFHQTRCKVAQSSGTFPPNVKFQYACGKGRYLTSSWVTGGDGLYGLGLSY